MKVKISVDMRGHKNTTWKIREITLDPITEIHDLADSINEATREATKQTKAMRTNTDKQKLNRQAAYEKAYDKAYREAMIERTDYIGGIVAAGENTSPRRAIDCLLNVYCTLQLATAPNADNMEEATHE